MRDKYKLLNSLDEDQFRTDVLIPLLKRIGYKKVRLRHGPAEYGKDITCVYSTPLTTDYIAVVAKMGDISGAASNRRVANILGEIREQVEMAFDIEVEDGTDGIPKSINKVIVWISGKISSNADRRITRSRSNQYLNVEFKDGHETIELLDEYYSSYWTIGDVNISNYFSKATEKYSDLEELYALGGSNTIRKLPAVFVSPTLELVEKIRSQQAKQEGHPPKRYNFSRLLQTTRQHTAIIGPMGSGKSTLLRRLLLSIIDNNQVKLQKYPIPIYLKFKQLDLSDDKCIHKVLNDEFFKLSEAEDSVETEDLLVQGNVVILIDGLDEVETEENINKALEYVTSHMRSYPRTRVVITSRTLEIFRTTNILSSFSVYKVRNLDYSQMQKLIRNWFSESTASGEQLIKLISQPITFMAIPATPLTLALMSVLYESGFHELPANLTELFEKYTEVALGRWDLGKGISSQIEWRYKQLMLRRIAWLLIENEKKDISLPDLTTLVNDTQSERGLTLNSNILIKELLHRSGLLVRNGDNNYEFKHKAFHDFFAGTELSEHENSVQIIIDKFMDMAWSRVIFFACGLKRERRDFLTGILDNVAIPNKSHFHYALQVGLVAQASYLAPIDIKITAVKKSLYSFVQAWNEITKNILEEKEFPHKKPPHMVLLDFLSTFVAISLGSQTLQKALTAVTQECLDNHLIDNMTPETRTETEWFKFFLSIASIHAENTKDFVRLTKSGMITNPSMLYICKVDAEIISNNSWVTSEEKAMLNDAIKSLSKKLKANAEHLNELFDRPPSLLSLPSSEQTET